MLAFAEGSLTRGTALLKTCARTGSLRRSTTWWAWARAGWEIFEKVRMMHRPVRRSPERMHSLQRRAIACPLHRPIGVSSHLFSRRRLRRNRHAASLETAAARRGPRVEINTVSRRLAGGMHAPGQRRVPQACMRHARALQAVPDLCTRPRGPVHRRAGGVRAWATQRGRGPASL